MSTVRTGGLCEGYAGLFLALAENLPVEHAWYAENDENASKVLAHHYPGVDNYGDITQVDWAAVGRAGRADGGLAVLTAGWPCQPFSQAGKRRGVDDERHLWPTGVLPAIRELMPPLFVGENVRGLLTIEDGQVFAQVLADLDDLGYTTSWTVIGACKVGACHHRHRVFIAATLVETAAPMSDPVAHRTGEGWAPAQFVLFGDASAVTWPASGFTSGGTAWALPVETCGADGPRLITPTVEDAGRNGSQEWADRWRAGEVIPETQQRLRTQVLMLPTPRTSDTNGAGQHGDGGPEVKTAVAMLPTPLVQDGTRDRTFPGDLARKSPALEAVVSMLPTPRASDADKGGPNQRGSSGDVMLPAAVQPQRFGKYATAVHRHELAFGLAAPDPTEPGRNGKPRLSAAFPEFMMGLPPGWLTDVVDRKAALKLAGNGVVWRQAAYALSTLPTFRAAVAALSPVEVAA